MSFQWAEMRMKSNNVKQHRVTALNGATTCAVILVALMLLHPHAAAFEVGVATAVITPDVEARDVPLAGYGSRLGRPATGVHDPLHAKVLFLDDGTQPLALVTVDLRSSTPEFKEQIVNKSEALGFTLDTVFVAASHTHAGPSMYPERFWQLQFGVYDPAIVDEMTSAIAAALTEAADTAVPMHMGYGVGQVEEATRNRRWEYNLEQRTADGETPLVDPRLAVVRFDDLAGACRALVVHFASHPTILSAANMDISAEWPGVLQRELEEAFPGATVLFLNGALGDQAPVAPDGEDEFTRMEQYGVRIAHLAAEIAGDIETKPETSVAIVRKTPSLPPLSFSEDAKRRFAAFKNAAEEALPRQAELQLLCIGPVWLAGLPGEPLLAVGQAVEQQLKQKGSALPLAVGLANDYIGYIVNEKEYAHGGYEVESRSFYGPGLGAFIEKALASLAESVNAPFTEDACGARNNRETCGLRSFYGQRVMVLK